MKPTPFDNSLEQRDTTPTWKPKKKAWSSSRSRSRSSSRSQPHSQPRSRPRSRSQSTSRIRTPGPGATFKVGWVDVVKGARSVSEEAASQGKLDKLEAEIAQIKQMLTQRNQKMTALGEENKTLKKELQKYKRTKHAPPVVPPLSPVTPTEKWRKVQPPKCRTETQANEDQPTRVTPENKVLKEIQQSVKDINEWMSNASRLISALTDRVENI
ncbi:hypothetical protein HPB51_009419 [Rhipicephalus microplus]|uniref:Uncharacterized protein n=1 Tax=Rhipicephalus microplus TaxID=6941 RepID=A0A9J6E139_RHIMP|nr:hypothetical protein HPB51_009419 [Rhipicephalus microplus]